MAENKSEALNKKGALGAVRIADEVVSIIAGLAATEVKGIEGMSGGIAGGIAEILGKKNFRRVSRLRSARPRRPWTFILS